MMFLTIYVGFLIALASCADENWSYTGKNGPSYWKNKFPECGGKKQSPINIGRAIYNDSFRILKFNNYKGNGLNISNNGHSVTFTFIDGDGDVFLFDDLLFQFVQFHLHWGSVSGRGSEHSLRGLKYDAEIHFVHFDISKYGSFEEAASEPNGLAVIAVFVQKGRQNNEFQKYSRLLYHIREAGSAVRYRYSVNLLNLIPKSKSYFSYSGSLTTPPCSETVQWFVFKDAITFSAYQLESLRRLQGKHGSMSDNFRPIQKRKKRTVFTNDKRESILPIRPPRKCSGRAC